MPSSPRAPTAAMTPTRASRGDLYLNIDSVLNALRPTVPGQRSYAGLDDPAYCEGCQSMYAHEDNCWVEAQRARLDDRRHHAIASHIHCPDMGNVVIDQVQRCLLRIEDIAQQVRTHETYAEDDGMAVRPEHLLPIFRLNELNVSFDPSRPATIAAARHHDLE